MKGSIGFIVLALLAVGVMLFAVGYAQPGTSPVDLPDIPGVPSTPETPSTPITPSSPETPIVPLPEGQPPPPNDEAPPSQPPVTQPILPSEPENENTTTVPYPTLTYVTKYVWTDHSQSSGGVGDIDTERCTFTYPVNHQHTVYFSVRLPEGGAKFTAILRRSEVSNGIIGSVTALRSYDTSASVQDVALYSCDLTSGYSITFYMESLGGLATAHISVYVTGWPSNAMSLIAGLPDISLAGILMMAAGAVLMFVKRK